MSETAMHITQVGTVIVPVTDQDRPLEFYVGTLGFEKRLDGEYAPGERWIEVGEHVPPMFTFCDPDGNRLRVVERS